DLKEKLAELGTTLITAQAGGTFGQQDPTLPKDVVARVTRVPTVQRSSAVSEINGVLTIPDQGSQDYYQAFPTPVLAADARLPEVLQVPIESGRWLSKADEANHTRAVVIGSGLARQYGVIPGEIRTIKLNGIDFGVIGVLGPVALDPNLDNAAFVTQWAAQHELGTKGEPTKLYVRAKPGTTQLTSDALPTAINLGGTDSVTTKIPSDALEASARADKTLQQTALFAGLLALAVGGLGIANVMSISVIQRSSEIGIRRALGSTRPHIAVQFLLEALFVGLLGGMIGALLGVGIVYLVSGFADWVVVINYGKMPIWIGLAVAVAAIAGLYPSVKAARLEPLETLRLG
ncbi:MAG TPA: ABC transporter permease, partial [Dongiaceae bacterium]|nr:ABC transporter permease [Dongiaceae bacterium]